MTTADLFESALKMDFELRLELACKLLRSIDEEKDPDRDRLYAEEIRRRSDEVHAGTAHLLTAEESDEQIRDFFAKRRSQ